MNPATVNLNQSYESVGLEQDTGVSASGSTDGGVAAGVCPEKSVDPEQLERSEICQQEVDQLVSDIIARVCRLEELMNGFRHSVIPLRISPVRRMLLMRSGGYLTSLWTRNKCEKTTS